jgi:aminopeptidase YwaD
MRMNEAALRAHVDRLAATPRVLGTKEHAAARAYIREQLASFGYSPREAPFGRHGGTNVHATRGGPGGPLFVVGAHYDSVVGSPGADDNASGVAALLEIARSLAVAAPGVSLEFVAYDQEENGLAGSRAHCLALQRDRVDVAGMLSLEMLGFTGDDQIAPPGVATTRERGDFLAVVANTPSADLLRMFEGLESLVPMERVVAPEETEAAVLAGLSDHGSFWTMGWPALLVTDTALLRNPHYHAHSDRPETLDYTFLARATEAVLAAVRRLLERVPGGLP